MTISIKNALAATSLFILAACGGSSEDPAAAETPAEETAATETTAAPEAEADAGPELIPAPEGSLAGGDMTLGSADAPLTIVEYASVTCPGCAAFHASIFPRLKEEFIDKGELQFVYKEFPTAPVRKAQAGFIIARCAATEGGGEAYFSIVDALYKTQRAWAYGDETASTLRNLAAQAGIDEQGFEDCFLREDIRDSIVSSIEEGRDAGVSRTPTLLIDGEPFDFGSTADEAVERVRAEIEKRRN